MCIIFDNILLCFYYLMFHVKHSKIISREIIVYKNLGNNRKIVVKVLVLYYTYCDAINSYGNRSGSEDSSLNICYLCASLFLGDDYER